MPAGLSPGHPRDRAQVREGFIGATAELREAEVSGGVTRRAQANQPAQDLRADRPTRV
jgi:hypothetical protein